MKRKIGLFLLQTFVYLIFAIPFKVINLIPGFTDVRPVSALTLYMAYSMAQAAALHAPSEILFATSLAMRCAGLLWRALRPISLPPSLSGFYGNASAGILSR